MEICESNIYMNVTGQHFVQPGHMQPIIEKYLEDPDYGGDWWQEFEANGVVYDAQVGVAAVNSETGYTYGEFYVYGIRQLKDGTIETDTSETLGAGMFRVVSG